MISLRELKSMRGGKGYSDMIQQSERSLFYMQFCMTEIVSIPSGKLSHRGSKTNSAGIKWSVKPRIWTPKYELEDGNC